MNVTTERQVTEQEVIEAVRKYVKDQHPGGAVLKVLTQGIRHEQDWWYVTIQPDKQPPKRFEYYESLAAVEEELQRLENLTVLLVPGVPEEAELAAA